MKMSIEFQLDDMGMISTKDIISFLIDHVSITQIENEYDKLSSDGKMIARSLEHIAINLGIIEQEGRRISDVPILNKKLIQ